MDVLIAGGGTGGHLFPGVALAQELRRRHPQGRILFVGTARGIETRAVPKAGFDLQLLPVSGLRGTGLLGGLTGLGRLPLAMWGALRLVRRFKPQVAVSVGGYAAGPAVLAAKMLGVPCVVMEQNAVAGITNRMLGRLADRVVTAMPCADFPPAKTQVLGNPVRADLLPIRELAYAPHAPPRLLVLGGSQGARALNEVMMAAAPLLVAAGVQLPVLHQTGVNDVDRVQAAYQQAGLHSARATAFIDDMAITYQNADLLLCRAGATTLAEVTVCGRPSILVPFPFAAGDHQTANAQVVAAANGGILIPQSHLSASALVALLQDLINNPARLQAMAARARELGKPHAVQAIADTLEQLPSGVPHV